MITWLAIVGALALVALIPWELMQREPIINVHLFKHGNFAIAQVLFLALGIVLFGTTQFIPQLLQEVLGYTAENAGFALTAGGIATILVMPAVGVLSSHVDARYLVAFGFAAQAAAFWTMGQLSTQMSFFDAAFVRMLQSVGLPFLFIPLTTVAYVGLRPSENNQASALMNVVRNLGGTIGISFVQTLLARGAQHYQSRLVEQLNPLNPNYTDALRQMTQGLASQGAAANSAALGSLYQNVQQQAQMLSYLTVFHVLLWVTVAALPLVFLMRRARAHGPTEVAA
jgi:DHA2 family multidrug resistance protein